MLGMYHCINPSKNERKYYHVLWDHNEKCYICKYGRLGSSPKIQKYHKTQNEMEKFMKSKLRKGYNFIPGHEETIGEQSNTYDYIMRLNTGF